MTHVGHRKALSLCVREKERYRTIPSRPVGPVLASGSYQGTFRSRQGCPGFRSHHRINTNRHAATGAGRTTMHHLLYELKALVQRNRDGSYSTQANRHAMLQQMGQQLLTAGYNQLHVYELKGRHLNTLLRQWQADGLSAATQKNRMAVLRWWAEKIGNTGLLQPTNAAYGIAKRQ